MKLARSGGGAARALRRRRVPGFGPVRMRGAGVGIVVLLAGICTPHSAACAASGEPTSSRAARDEAVRAIPWRNMAPSDRHTAQAIIKNASFYRRLPTRVIDCDPEMFSFLLQHPEVVIDVWRVMGISQVSLEKLSAAGGSGAVYRGTDGAGTTGTVRFLFSNWGQNARNLAVIYADGKYEGKPFLAPLKAQSILLLRTGAVQETNGRHYVTVRIDSFVRVEQLGVELIAKTVQPWINKTADHNLIETLSFLSNFSRTAERNPQGMQRLATRLATVDEPTRNELVALCFRTAERYTVRQGNSDPTSSLFAQKHVLAMRRQP